MKIVSDNCKCSSCLKKYFCPDYAMIVSIQNIAGKYLAFGDKNIQLVFQTEYCPNKKNRSKALV